MDPGLNRNNKIERLLNQELACFHKIRDASKTFLADSNSTTVGAIVKLLDEREGWITLLKQIEKERKFLKEYGEQEEIALLREEIIEIAQTLVVIDARILDILQTKKMQTVKEMAEIADKHNRNRLTGSTGHQESRIIDIRQE